MSISFDQLRTLAQIETLEPATLERFVSWLYARDGYEVLGTTRTGGDGVDLLVSNGGRQILVQCKHGRTPIGQPAVRDIYAAMHAVQAAEAHLVATAAITSAAQDWAGGKPITLVDGTSLEVWVNRVPAAPTAAYTPAPQPAPTAAPQPAPAPAEEGTPWLGLLIGAGLALLVICALLAGGTYWYFDLGAPPATPALQAPTPVGQDTTPTADASQPQPVATVTPRGGTSTADAAPVAVRLSTPPTLDGRLDEWADVPSVTSSQRVYAIASWNGTADLTAVWRLGWDDQNLYVAVAVQDDTHVQTQTGNQTFKGDSLEMQFDTDRAGDIGRNTLSADDWQIVLSPGNFTSLPPEAFRFHANDSGQMRDATGHSIQLAAVRQPDGYTIEVAIPWADLALTPSAGLVLGLNLNANDNDTSGAAVQEVMMSNNINRTFSNPTTWGTLELR